ncbi:MAG: M1 family aminopeptidase [Candidatus Zixiibacteriota bacterium]
MISLAAVAVVTVMHAPAVGRTFTRLAGPDRAIYDSLSRPHADPAAFFTVVPGVEWETVLGTYRFESGTLSFFTPVGGRPSGCLFRGVGTLQISPPSAMERDQLERYTGDSILTMSVTEVYFRFFDRAVAAGLYRCCGAPGRGKAPRDADLRSFDHDARDDLAIDLATRGWQSRRDGDWSTSFLYAAPKAPNQRRLHFIWDEAADESIRLWRRPPGATPRGSADLVCSYDRARDAGETPFRVATLHGGFVATHCRAEVTISRPAAVTVDASLTLSLRHPDVATLGLAMAPDLIIDSVWVNGSPAPFIYDDAGAWIIVGVPAGQRLQDSAVARFTYRSTGLLRRLPWSDDFYIRHTTRWLPSGLWSHPAMHDVTFRVPRGFDLVSVGALVSDSLAGDWHVTRWRTYEPVSFISFNYGSFERRTVQVDSGIRLDIYRSRNHRRGLFNSDMSQRVADEIVGAVTLFSQLFGRYPWDHLAATEIPGGHGQGFPQLLHLAWYSFETSRKGITDAFIAHEVAHQWFGHLVGWQTYHDQWLSEGFAEYASAMFVQARHPGGKEFSTMLSRWRQRVLQTGGHRDWHAGPQVAPIWLGYRCASESSPASYSHLVYAKGAYVLHMLRAMLHDERTGSDERFIDMMHDYVRTMSHANAATADFQRVVEAHVGQPMQWFFDQWVYGVQIPRFEYRWDRERLPDGRYIVRGRIDKFDCDSSFRCIMPITFVTDSGRVTIRQEISRSTTIFTSPPLHHNAKEVLFNDGQAILCREKLMAGP